MSTRTEFPAKAPDHLCPGFWMDPYRNLRSGDKQSPAGWAPCEQPGGHLTKCGPRRIFDNSVVELGPRACHVIGDHPQLFLDA